VTRTKEEYAGSYSSSLTSFRLKQICGHAIRLKHKSKRLFVRIVLKNILSYLHLSMNHLIYYHYLFPFSQSLTSLERRSEGERQ